MAGPLIGPRDIKPIARNRCDERRLSGVSCGVRAEPWLLPPISTSLKRKPPISSAYKRLNLLMILPDLLPKHRQRFQSLETLVQD